MRSVQSLGGPLILLPHSALQGWFGAYGPRGEDDVDEEETAYWRVSQSVTDYADVVEAAGVSALVLANGNARTTFLPDRMLFVQEVAGRLLPRDWERLMDVVPGLAWEHRSGWTSPGPGLLFDSAMYGPDVTPEDALAVDMPAGTYDVLSAYRRPDEVAGALLVVTMLSAASR